MRREARAEKGLPEDPVLALRARELLAEVRQLVAAQNWREAAPRSHALVQLAPGLAEGYELMGVVALKTGAPKIAEGCFERAVAIGPATASRLLHWGKALYALGEPAAAEKVLHRALLIRPDDPAILTDLGDAQLSQRRPADALRSFRRALRKQPDHRYAAHMVSALGEDGVPDKSYVTRLFDDYADIFDHHLTGTLGYNVPEVLAQMLKAQGRPFHSALDIGVGTGLVGAALTGLIEQIDGVDLAPRMIEKARKRNIYRNLAVGDAAEVLRADPAFAGPYDLVVAADVFIYIGAIEGVLAAVLERLAPQGLVAFSIETTAGSDIEIRPSGRFAHTDAYISKLAADHGLVRVDRREHPIRLEDKQPIMGALYVLAAR